MSAPLLHHSDKKLCANLCEISGGDRGDRGASLDEEDRNDRAVVLSPHQPHNKKKEWLIYFLVIPFFAMQTAILVALAALLAVDCYLILLLSQRLLVALLEA